MFQNKQKNLAELCPQCYKLINSSENRLVHDTCGHLKCRICLLQEIAGCLLCVTERQLQQQKQNNSVKLTVSGEPQQRKSVITSLAIQKAEQNKKEETKSLPLVDKDTCHVIQHSLEKDILFPTEIVQKSTGNFYHLKRVFSQRFFNEDCNKKHKTYETEEKWSNTEEKGEKSEDENSETRDLKIPSHIKVQYYCNVHKAHIMEKNEVLKYHMMCKKTEVRRNGSLFQCSMCDKSYKDMGKLNRHMKGHTKNFKFKCEKCGKAYVDNYALRNHERTHTQQKPYSCNDCDKKFSAMQNYKRHESKHKNDKKFVCNECGFRFLTKVELKRHGITHTNMKPFVCSICSTKFAFKRTMLRHLRTHDANLSRLQCSQCESTFKRKDNLERHVKMCHEVKTENERQESCCDDESASQ